MEITILGRQDLENLVQKNSKQYDVVYYTHSESPKIDLIEKNALDSLHMPVDDIDHYELKFHISPTASSVKRFLDFGKGRKKLVVACAAGVSRSSSTAYLIAAQEYGPKTALTFLKPTHHFPNRLNVYIGSVLLKDPKVWEEYLAWSKHWSGVDPSHAGVWPRKELISGMGFDKV